MGINGSVALFTRAWIEIATEIADMMIKGESPSSRGRGLKLTKNGYLSDEFGRPLHEGVD